MYHRPFVTSFFFVGGVPLAILVGLRDATVAFAVPLFGYVASIRE